MQLPFTLPFALPDWLPAWAFLLLALPVLLYGLAFLVMPFSVFGVKSRLEGLEQQLEIIQDELRHLGNRNLARPAPEDQNYDVPDFSRVKSARAALPPGAGLAPPPRGEPRDARAARRTEPRLD